MARLNATVRRRSEITDDALEAMFRLYASYYDATSLALFRSDLDGKELVIELTEGEELRGFSTLAVLDFSVAGIPRRALYSGDTIIDHRYWGEQALPHAFCRLAGSVKAREPALPLYWLLISKGYRTYRYLSLFAKTYYPNPHEPTPRDAQSSIDTLAAMLFGSAYSPRRGVVAYPSSRGHLAPEWAAVKTAVRERPEVRFFLERNPRYCEGEELCCLTALEAGNLRSSARRAFLEGYDEHEALLSGDRRLGGAFSNIAAAGADGSAAAPASYSRP